MSDPRQPRTYLVRPVRIQALQYDGTPESVEAITAWVASIERTRTRIELVDGGLDIRLDRLRAWLHPGEWLTHSEPDGFDVWPAGLFADTCTPEPPPEPEDSDVAVVLAECPVCLVKWAVTRDGEGRMVIVGHLAPTVYGHRERPPRCNGSGAELWAIRDAVDRTGA